MTSITKREPIILIGIVAAGIIAVLEAAVIGDVLGAEIGEELVRLTQVVVAVIAVVLGRQNVVSPAKYDADVEDALNTPVPPTE
jgi:hypothetical protein